MKKSTDPIPVSTIIFTILPQRRTWWQLVFGLNEKKKIKFHHFISAEGLLLLGCIYQGDNGIRYKALDYRKDKKESTILMNTDKDWTSVARSIKTIQLIGRKKGENNDDQN